MLSIIRVLKTPTKADNMCFSTTQYPLTETFICMTFLAPSIVGLCSYAVRIPLVQSKQVAF